MGAGGARWWRRELEALALLRHASEPTPSKDAVAAGEGSGCGLQYIGDGVSGGCCVGANGISVGGGVVVGVVVGGGGFFGGASACDGSPARAQAAGAHAFWLHVGRRARRVGGRRRKGARAQDYSAADRCLFGSQRRQKGSSPCGGGTAAACGRGRAACCWPPHLHQ